MEITSDTPPDHLTGSEADGKRTGPSPAADLKPADVAAFLRRNPDFLVHHPDVAAGLKTPGREIGQGVADLQSFIVEKLRGDIGKMRLTQRKLIATSRNNLVSQGRVHSAVIALLGARSFEDFITIITEELAGILDVDAVGLAIETPRSDIGMAANSGVQVVPPGTLDEVMDEDDVVLRADVVGDSRLYGEAAAGLVRSDVLVRLQIGTGAPPALLCMGARRPGIFHPGQGTELVGFLAQVIELTMRAWLDLPD